MDVGYGGLLLTGLTLLLDEEPILCYTDGIIKDEGDDKAEYQGQLDGGAME